MYQQRLAPVIGHFDFGIHLALEIWHLSLAGTGAAS
jgi:hypothetical protein